jgi:hypothetical protein
MCGLWTVDVHIAGGGRPSIHQSTVDAGQVDVSTSTVHNGVCSVDDTSHLLSCEHVHQPTIHHTVVDGCQSQWIASTMVDAACHPLGP